MNNPVIAIPCFKKPKALIRLLSSLSNAKYPFEVKIIFSVDFSGNDEVFDIVDNFEWIHGDKEIIRYDKNIGLRQNILNCGEKALEYGSVIVLEDDTYVSKYFYCYALNAKDFYLKDDEIAGISLYAYEYSEIGGERFFPLYDGYDTYFMQWASSWGQLWTAKHWTGFVAWYQKNKKRNLNSFNVPQNVIAWPESSWKKYFIAYLCDAKKFFVYPHTSFVSNCGDPGCHCGQESFLSTQVCIPQSYNISSIKFAYFSSTIAKYDVFFQSLPECLKRMNTRLIDYDFDVDIAGTKEKQNIEKEYLLSPKQCNKPIFSFDHALIPFSLNVINNLEGNYLFFGRAPDFTMKENLSSSVLRWKINRTLPSAKKCMNYVFLKILKKLKLDRFLNFL